jgi:phosphomannomutase
MLEIMSRAGHTAIHAVPRQEEPDGTFPTVEFPNPEEPGALDLAIEMANEIDADLVLANDPDADRLAALVPVMGEWRPLSGNEIGVLLAEYILDNDPDPASAIVASSIVSSPMLTDIATAHGAHHEQTLTGFKWIVKAGLALEGETGGRFVFGYEEALGYTIGTTVHDKDGLSAAVIFSDMAADARDSGQSVIERLESLWRRYCLWVSAQTSIIRTGADGLEEMRGAIARLGDEPPGEIDGFDVTVVTDYRSGGQSRPAWLGEQALIELTLGNQGRVLVRPSGTEPKLKIYVDLREDLGDEPTRQHELLTSQAHDLGRSLASSVGL